VSRIGASRGRLL